MPSSPRPAVAPFLCAALALVVIVPPAHALRVATWNVARYNGTQTSREAAMQTVVNGMNADVIILQELNAALGRDRFLNNVLNVAQPGQWAASSWFEVQSFPTVEGGAVFYKPAKVSILPPVLISTSERDVIACWVQPAGYLSSSAWFRMYSFHFKAGESDSMRRRVECTDLRNHLNTNSAGTNLLIGGDGNFYNSFEGGYLRLLEDQLDDDGRMKDPITMSSSDWGHSANALRHTQSPCDAGCPSGFTGGALDDRFDLWLSSYNLQDGQGLDYVAQVSMSSGAYPFAYGNDGSHFNLAVNDPPANTAVSATIAQALHDAADHLPVIITLKIPARVVAASTLELETAIVGGTSLASLAVENGVVPPGDALDYTLNASAGFTAPGAAFSLNPGLQNNHTISMNTSTSGFKSGTLTVNCDDPDSTAKPVQLYGTVLRHASASLDSTAALLSTSLDFGDHPIGGFSDMAVRAHNLGFDALQAGLSMDAANITGGDGRFSIVGGFTPVLLAGTGQTWNVHFDDTGATLDQEYTATLTFNTSDEAWSGATTLSNLTVSLRAKPVSGVAGVPDKVIPKALAFYAPRPNPVAHDVEIAFDLPLPAPASLGIYDLAGRRVATLVSGTLEADHHVIRWDGRSESGSRVGAGLYFARFSTPGLNRVARLIVLP